MKTTNVVVTGAAAGIGAAISRRLSEENWSVLGVDMRKPKGWKGPFIECDLAEADCGERVAKAVAAEGMSNLQGLVCNAGVMISKPVSELTATEFDRMMAVNVRSIFLLSKALYPQLSKAKGSLVSIGSVHALATTAGASAYACSKGAVSALTRALAVEWGPSGIRVNAVLPGAIDTEMLKTGLKNDPVKLNRIKERTPLNRIGEPDEVADAVSFLLSDQAAFITGQLLTVDGGALSRLSTE